MQLNARIKHKRDTASNWATKNPTPLDGEIIIVETTDGNTKVKVGDGSTAYNNLPFMNEDLTIQVSENTSNISTLTNTKVTGVTSSKDGNVVVFDGTGGRLIKDSGKSLADYLLNEEILEATKRVSDVEVNQSVATIEALQTGLARVESNMIASVNGVKADTSGNVNVDVTLTKDKVTSALGYTPLQTAPVTSVDGKTGAVSLSNVYQPKGNYLTSAPVTSVMGKTGAVTGLVTSVNGTTADTSGNVELTFADENLNNTFNQKAQFKLSLAEDASTTKTVTGLTPYKRVFVKAYGNKLAISCDLEHNNIINVNKFSVLGNTGETEWAMFYPTTTSLTLTFRSSSYGTATNTFTFYQ